jgi:phosphoribosylaminoimidazole-succinocarboxamide synthase
LPWAIENLPEKRVTSRRLWLIQHRETQLAALDAAIFRSIEDAERSLTKPTEEVLDRLEAKYQSLAQRPKRLF